MEQNIVKRVNAINPKNCNKLVRSHDSIIGKEELAKEFEDLYQKQLDLTRGDGQRYKDDCTDIMWRAFKLAFTRQQKIFQRTTSLIRRETVKGPFIIGADVADNTVQFAYRPVKHNTFQKAKAEAGNLTAKYGKNFSVYGFLEQTRPQKRSPAIPVEESFAGAEGRRKNRPFHLLDRLAKTFDSTVDGYKHNTQAPATIMFSCTGKILVEYTAAERRVFDNAVDFFNYLEGWLKHNEGKSTANPTEQNTES